MGLSKDDLFLAIKQKNKSKVIECLSTISPSVLNEDGETPLMVAIKNKSIRISKLILKHEGSLANEAEGFSPLMMASKYSLPSMVSAILPHVDVDHRSQYHYTAAHIAATFDTSGKCLALIIEAGANLGIKDVHGETPLFSAIRFENDNAFDMLIRRSDLNVKSIYGETPLMLAAIIGNREYVRELLPFSDLSAISKKNLLRKNWRFRMGTMTSPRQLDLTLHLLWKNQN